MRKKDWLNPEGRCGLAKFVKALVILLIGSIILTSSCTETKTQKINRGQETLKQEIETLQTKLKMVKMELEVLNSAYINMKNALDKNRFMVYGEIKEREGNNLKIWGNAIPRPWTGRFVEGMLVFEKGNIIVQNARNECNFGFVYNSSRINHYYIGKEYGTNAFGAKVPVYVYTATEPPALKSLLTQIEEKDNEKTDVENELNYKTVGLERINSMLNRLNRLEKPVEEIKFDKYIYRSYSDNNCDIPSYFEILYNGKSVYKQDGWKFGLYSSISTPAYPPGVVDITGDKIPEILITSYVDWSGKGNICIFSLGEKKLEKISLPFDGVVDKIEDLDGDNIPELVTLDDIFELWEASHATSPPPYLRIIFRYKNKRYQLASDLMVKPPPKPEEIQVKIDKVMLEFEQFSKFPDIGQDPRWANVPESLWKYMLDLIYSGNSNSAWEFFDKAYPENRKGKKEFLEAFKAQLAKSPYWSEFQKSVAIEKQN